MDAKRRKYAQMQVDAIKHELDASSSSQNDQASQDYDIVAQISHNRIKNIQSATFKRHQQADRSAGSVYSIDLPNERNGSIVFCGKENETARFGYDYMVAIVNRRTGLTDFVPVKLVTFERTFSSDPNTLLGIKPPSKVNYEADNASTRESWAEKRRALTSEFGSARKIKMQESANRRQIKDETLKTMMDSSALFSPAGMNKEDEKATPNSLLIKATSSVLPKPNNEAKTPRDVYSYDVFLSQEEVAFLKKSSLEFLNRPEKELLDAGFPSLVHKRVGVLENNEKRACFVLLLATMVHCYKLVARPSKRSISDGEWSSLPYPTEFTTKMRELFFAGEFSSRKSGAGLGKGSMSVNSAEKDKLLAHILCLILMLDTENMCIPITPWAKELTCPDGKIAKVATALGCSVTSATPAEGVRLGTIHIARLVGPPSAKKGWKTPRRR